VQKEKKRSSGRGTRLGASPVPDLPPLEGEDLEAGESERQRFVRVMFEREGPLGVRAEVAAAIRDRAKVILEKETEAKYWVEGGWRWDVFGWSRAAWERVAWTPESLVRVELDVQRPLAGVWALAAWSEGLELEAWLRTCANLWMVELARVTDELWRRPPGRTVDGLYKLADEALDRGECKTAGILGALALVLDSGDCEEVVAGLLVELVGTVAADRLAFFLDPSTERPTVGGMLHLMRRVTRGVTNSVSREIGPPKERADLQTRLKEELRELPRRGCIDPNG
jgi:hypothetical protein